MTGMARLLLAGFLVSLIAGALICPPAAAQETSAPPPAITPIDGEPPELHDVAAQLQQLHDSGRRGGEVRALCQARYDAATDLEHRAYFLWYIGRSYAKEEKFDRALEIYAQVLQQYPNSRQTWWTKYYMAKAYYGKARVANGKANAALAIPLLEQLLKEYPNHPSAERPRKLLGACYEKLGNPEVALKEYQNPDQPPSLMRLRYAVALLQKMGRWDDAIVVLKRIGEDTRFSRDERGAGWLTVASFENRAGRPKDALRTLEWLEKEAALFDRTAPDLWRGLELVRLEANLATGQTGDAEGILLGLLADYPGSYEAYLGLMKTVPALSAGQGLERAAGYLRKVAEDRRFQADWRGEAYLELGKLYLTHLNDPEKARASLQAAVDVAPGSSAAKQAADYLAGLGGSRAGSPGPVLLSPAEMESTKGGWTYNYKICDGARVCGDECKSDLLAGTSEKTVPVPLIKCRDQNWFERLTAPAWCEDFCHCWCGTKWYWPSHTYCPDPESADPPVYLYDYGCGY